MHLKDNQIVATVGDGVNDGPALKAPYRRGWEKGIEISAKSAADLADDFFKMIVAGKLLGVASTRI
jgi:Ca2+-transporting ATPase